MARTETVTVVFTDLADAIFPIVSPATGQVIGTIDVESERINAFTAEDKLFLQACADLLHPLWLR